MKIKRSEKIANQVKEATDLRLKLLSQLRQYKKIDGSEVNSIDRLVQAIELSAEGYKLILKDTPVSEVDRKSSMLSGPFFSSKEYISYWGNMPIIQLDLREISQLAGRDFGDGLFIFYYEPEEEADMQDAFSIPRAEIETQAMTPFGQGEVDDEESGDDADNENEDEELESPYEEEIFRKSSDTVKVIVGYESIGMQSQVSTIEFLFEELPESIKLNIKDDLNLFTKLTKSKDVFHILGSFYPIQYDVNEVAMPCLVHFPQWNATGNAQIFMSSPGHFEYYESYD
jgi:hypothetical protein